MGSGNSFKTKIVRRICLFAFLLIFLFSSSILTSADSLDFESGNSYYAVLETQSNSENWAGAKIQHNGASLTDSATPFTSFTFSTGSIFTLSFAGNNLKDGFHYYAAMLPNSFQLANVDNATLADTLENGFFNSIDFPTFYPDYDSSDSPAITFTGTGVVTLAEVNYSSITTTIESGITYHALKYFDGAKETVLFLVEIDDVLCYDSTSCVAEFLVPINTNPYNFYALSKLETYDFRVFVDSVETTIIPQTALAYNVTVEATGRLDGLIKPNVTVAIGEDEGQNIFIPYHLSGYISSAYSVGKTNALGRESWLVAPTVYPTYSDYSIYVGAIRSEVGGISGITSRQELSVSSKDSVIQLSKPLTPSLLSDDAKVAVNAMAQIINFAFIWASQDQKAKIHPVTYFGSFLTSAPEFKTGAINVIRPNLPSGHTLRVKEDGGYLLMNPYTGNSPFRQKGRVDYHEIPNNGESVIIPTNLGVISSNITLQVLDSSGLVIAEQNATIDGNLEEPVGGDSFYNNDLLKTIVNQMNAVSNSLFYSLNN